MNRLACVAERPSGSDAFRLSDCRCLSASRSINALIFFLIPPSLTLFCPPLMPPGTFSPSLPTNPTQSWTQDSTLDDVQQEPQSEVPEGVFEKKWIVTEDGDESASYFPLSICSWTDNSSSGEFSSRYAALGPLPFCSNDAIPTFQFEDGIDKNGIFFDPNIDSSSETTEGAYHTHLPVTPSHRTSLQ